MLYELRHYMTADTTSLGAVTTWAGQHLVPGWKAAGVRVVGCFTTLFGPTPRFSTLLAFDDANDRQTQLDAFYASPAWLEMEAGLYPDGRALVTGYDTLLLRPTAYSPDPFAFLDPASPGIFEERIYRGKDVRAMAKVHRRFNDHTVGLFAQYGIVPVGFWSVEVGADQPSLYYLVRYNSLAEREAPWAAFRADPTWQQVYAESEKDGPILLRVTANILAPTAYSPLH